MTSKIVVIKFGGTSVAEPKHWRTIAERLQFHLGKGNCPIVVLSALKNVSNRLEELLHLAIQGKHNEAIKDLKVLHLTFSQQLKLDTEKLLQPWFSQLEEDCRSIYQKALIDPSVHARVLAIGELLSTTIGAEYLRQQGFELLWQDARKLLKSTTQQDPWHHYTSAECNYEYDVQTIEKLYGNRQPNNQLVVTQGFIASDSKGETVLLGREGSDTSAAYLAAMTGTKQLEIWTDVTGVFSANPREIGTAKPLPYLSYSQSYLMAKFGAKVLHPRVLKPAEQNGIIVNVRSTSQAAHPGTIISTQNLEESEVIAVVTEPKVGRLIFKGRKAVGQSERIISLLNSLGFDIILDGHSNDKYYVIVKYVNTDKASFNQMELKTSFSKEKLNTYDEGALVTLVTETNHERWNHAFEDWINAQEGGKVVDYFHKNDSPTYILLVALSDSLSISQLLHRKFIEKN